MRTFRQEILKQTRCHQAEDMRSIVGYINIAQAVGFRTDFTHRMREEEAAAAELDQVGALVTHQFDSLGQVEGVFDGIEGQVGYPCIDERVFAQLAPVTVTAGLGSHLADGAARRASPA